MTSPLFDKIERLIELARKHGVHELAVEDKDGKITVVTSAGSAPAPTMYAPPIYAQHQMPQAAMYAAPQAASPQTAPAEGATGAGKKPTTSGKVIKSPFVGTFYRAPAPGSDNFADVGKRVKKGDTLCIIEAMKLMNEIEAEFDGVIKEILAENEQPVEFDQPLFVIE
jgi:acetyl-CoA carboxylase biotin carboxyl carrier protein